MGKSKYDPLLGRLDKNEPVDVDDLPGSGTWEIDGVMVFGSKGDAPLDALQIDVPVYSSLAQARGVLTVQDLGGGLFGQVPVATLPLDLMPSGGTWNVSSGLTINGDVGFFNTLPTPKATALTASLASTVDATYGTEEAGVINNLRTRVDELESKLQAYGLLS